MFNLRAAVLRPAHMDAVGPIGREGPLGYFIRPTNRGDPFRGHNEDAFRLAIDEELVDRVERRAGFTCAHSGPHRTKRIVDDVFRDNGRIGPVVFTCSHKSAHKAVSMRDSVSVRYFGSRSTPKYFRPFFNRRDTRRPRAVKAVEHGVPWEGHHGEKPLE